MGWKHRKTYLPLWAQNTLIMLFFIALAAAVCAMLKPVSDSDFHVPPVFVLAVLLVSRYTSGYVYGIIASVIAVIGVNYVFTYPYFHFNFSMTGYPLTFLCMFIASLLTSTMTSRVRAGEKARREGDREKMRANLLRAVSHDFRTPLTSIIGSVNAVLDNGDTISEEDKTRLLSDARSEAEWLVHMVENLLSITRIQADPEAELHKEPQVVEEVLWEAVSRFRKQFGSFRVDISVPEEVLVLPMDAVLIEQVVLNLLMNAAVHGRTATSAELSVTTDPNWAIFSVKDNGEGISPEKMPSLFEGYGTKVAEESGPIRSMGIGLSVCRTIIQTHGGNMSARNVPGGGACITFTLPLESELVGEEEVYGDETEDPCGRG